MIRVNCGDGSEWGASSCPSDGAYEDKLKKIDERLQDL